MHARTRVGRGPEVLGREDTAGFRASGVADPRKEPIQMDEHLKSQFAIFVVALSTVRGVIFGAFRALPHPAKQAAVGAVFAVRLALALSITAAAAIAADPDPNADPDEPDRDSDGDERDGLRSRCYTPVPTAPRIGRRSTSLPVRTPGRSGCSGSS